MSATSLNFDEKAVWSILAGLRNGIYYGCKIRFPHALVMTILFGKGDVMQRLRSVIKATYTHARNLGLFVFVFKLVRALFRHFRQVDDPLNTLLAGFIGGGIMFGRNDPITSQINMYIMSRVIFGLARTASNFNWVQYRPWMFTLFGATAWALVMYLYYHQDKVLQGSLTASMNFIYGDTDVAPITSLWKLITQGVSQ